MLKLLQGIDAIKRPVCGRVVYSTPVETLQKSREVIDPATGGVAIQKGLPVPSKFDGLMRLVSRVCNIGNDYTTAVKRQIDNGSGDSDTWQTSEHKWAEVDPAYPRGNVYQHRQHKDQKYIKIYEDMSSKLKDASPFDPTTGNLVTMTWGEACAFLKKDPTKSGSAKQENAGVAKQVKFRLVKAENIRYLKCGEFIYDALTKLEAEILKTISE